MFKLKTHLLNLIFLVIGIPVLAQQAGKTDAIYSGLPWYDQNGNVVSAHGANIVKDGGKFYLFGEAHSDTSNAFAGFNCYSSNDLYNWKFESIALPAQSKGKLGANRVGERVKVMKDPKSGNYIMYMHVDTLGYKDQFVGYATAKNITGPYTFRGPLLFNGKPIKKWDMGVFQDKDGIGYVLIHGGEIYKLSDDYKSIVSQVNKAITSGFESPTLFRKGNTYYFIGSNLSSWERNDNYYYTATSLSGPWTAQGLFVPKDKLTWNSQATFVLPIVGTKDTTYMFMGDRWSFPLQKSSATYVWQPFSISGDLIAIPQYQQAWQINTTTGIVSSKNLNGKMINNHDPLLHYKGKWQHELVSKADEKNASVALAFIGTQIGIYSTVQPENGYAKVVLQNKKGKVLSTNLIDMYSKSPTTTLVYLTPILPKDEYKLTVSVTGLRSNWSDKKKTIYGSTANFISIKQFIINE